MIRLKSPRATLVKSVAVSNGMLVKPGQFLMELDHTEEDVDLQKAERLAELFTKLEQGVAPAELSQRLRVAQDQVTACEMVLVATELVFRLQQGRYDAGVGTILELTDADNKQLESRIDLINKRYDLTRFWRDAQHRRATLRNLEEATQHEIDLIKLRGSRLSIKAPVSGRVSRVVLPGTYVRLGATLGEIV